MLLVLLFHADVPGFSGGFLGVDMFFVLSGYLITRILLAQKGQDQSPLWRFYERRARRLLPALGVVLLATAGLSALVLVPRVLYDVGTQLTATAVFAANLQHARGVSYFAHAATESPLLHTWSLAVEEQFYLFYPPLLLWLSTRSKAATRGTVVLLTVGSLLLATALQSSHPNLAFYLMPPRIWEFGIGALLALDLVPALRSQAARSAASLLALTTLALSSLGLTVGAAVPVALPAVLGTALLLHAEDDNGTAVGSWLRWTPLRGLGKISYGLYLWHWPLLVLSKALLWRGDSPPMWAKLMVLLVSTALAYASWKLVEQPLRTSGHSRRRVAAASLAGIGAAVAVGLLLRVDGGLPQRFSPETLALANAQSDVDPACSTCADVRGPRVCEHGPPNAPVDWIVWGDSHAGALLPAVLEAVGPEAGVHSITPSGCGPFFGVRRASILEEQAQACHVSNQLALTEVESHAPVNVLLHARWPAYAEGYLTQNHVPWEIVTELERRPAPFSLERTVSALEDAGARVFIATSAPEYSMRVPQHLVASRLLGWAPYALPISQHRERNAIVDEELKRLSDAGRVTIIDLTPALCTDTCELVADGRSVYRDSDHLSATAARQIVGPYLREAFSDLDH